MPSDDERALLYQAQHYFKNEKWGLDSVAGYEDYIALRHFRQLDHARVAAELFDRLPARPGFDGRPTLLDVGCAFGHFMDCAEDYGFDVEGVDINPFAIDYLQRKYRFTATCRDYSDFAGGPYDAVSMLDIIEHFVDPFTELKKSASLMRTGGVLVVTTLDLGTITARALNKWNVQVRKAASGEHLWFFTRRTLASALRQAGFSVLSIGGQGHTFDLATATKRLELELPLVGRVARKAVKVLNISNWHARFNHGHNMIAFARRE